jgi:hypothetical protein
MFREWSHLIAIAIPMLIRASQVEERLSLVHDLFPATLITLSQLQCPLPKWCFRNSTTRPFGLLVNCDFIAATIPLGNRESVSVDELPQSSSLSHST